MFLGVNMFVILDHNGKQFKVKKGDILRLDNLGDKKRLKFEKVLVFNNEDGETIIGSPFVSSVDVSGEVLENIKDKKVIVFKKKRRNNYRRKIGHRQQISVVKITDIHDTSKLKESSEKSSEKKN